jgi:hypothetical protein
VSTHGEVAVDAGVAEHADDLPVLENVELKDEREADDHRVGLHGSGDDLIGRGFDVTDDDVVSVLAECGREISQAKIALMLEADQKDGARGVASYRGCLRVEDRELRDIRHRDSLQCARDSSHMRMAMVAVYSAPKARRKALPGQVRKVRAKGIAPQTPEDVLRLP